MKITNRKYFRINLVAKTNVIPNLAFISLCMCELIKTCENSCWSTCMKCVKKKEVPSVKGTKKKLKN
jgi:hypothetical protein